MSKNDHDTTAKRHLFSPDSRDIAVAVGVATAGAGAAGLGFVAFYVFLVAVGTLIVAATVASSLR
jgi:hypothetical protein